MSQHWRDKDWVWGASEGSLRGAVVAAVDRIEALERERPCNGMMIADDKGGVLPFCNLKQRIEALEAALSNYTGGSHCNPARIALGLEPFRNGFALPLEDGVIK